MVQDDRDLGALRATMFGAILITCLIGCGIGGWAAATSLAGAVIAPGTVVIDGSSKKVQHMTGGIVAELKVRDGDEVHAGDEIIRLDETMVRSSYAIVSKSIDELLARQARLLAEQAGTSLVEFPAELLARQQDPEVSRLIVGERALFAVRAESRAGQKAQLRERIDQLREQIGGLNEQLSAKIDEIGLIKNELVGVRDLFKKDLVPINRVTALERDAARLSGEKGALIGTIAQAKGRITETELQIAQIDQDLRTEVGKELADIRGKLAEARERKVAAADQLARTTIKAPIDGIVHQLALHTVGGVIQAGETIMLIVPSADRLTVEARLPPRDIDHVRAGQSAMLRFSAFDQRTTPEIHGQVTYVSADTTIDPKSNLPFYTVRITPVTADTDRARMTLVPGMPVETFIQQGERSVLSFLLKPITDQIARTWREN